MRGNQQAAILGQLIAKRDPHTRRLLRIMLKTVAPLRVIEPHRKYRISGEGKPLAA